MWVSLLFSVLHYEHHRNKIHADITPCTGSVLSTGWRLSHFSDIRTLSGILILISQMSVLTLRCKLTDSFWAAVSLFRVNVHGSRQETEDLWQRRKASEDTMQKVNLYRNKWFLQQGALTSCTGSPGKQKRTHTFWGTNFGAFGSNEASTKAVLS